MAVITAWAESDTSSLVTAIINVTAPRLDIVQVKLSSLKSVVNEFPCPKSQGEFLKVPVANMFSASLYLHEMYGTCV